ncbi:DUF6777 domain-containing protein [Streptomyces sp. NPDC005805]|uniref:DUF6777 domain-containing protein n=1 Tax=Streptomyces sp. NPDC005805 TaxID=3157068 RepID=UPI0033F78FCC
MSPTKAESPKPSKPLRSPKPLKAPVRRLSAAAAAVCVGLLAAGCGGADGAAGPEALLLQPLAAPGPDPYTPSTAVSTAAFAPPPVTAAPRSPSGGGTTLRTLSGATPGLYGGIPETASCDVPAQIKHLTRHKDRTRAFAEAAGVGKGDVPAFLRGLTPVVLRADTRVTAHGFTDGRTAARQGVLQAGTAVLVDHYGAPRVRCAGGNPLSPPVAAKSAPEAQGTPWTGYRADRAVVVKPAAQVINNLVIVSVTDSSWIERPSGTRGEEDARPEVLPPVAAEEVFSDLKRTDGSETGADAGSVPSGTTGSGSGVPGGASQGTAPASGGTDPYGSAPRRPAEPAPEPPAPQEETAPEPAPVEPDVPLPDAGADPGADTGPDAGPDAGSGTGPDAGTGALTG